jgi:tRNA-dihydrouridine synthase
MLKTLEETIAFARGLVAAGAACITLHMRHPSEKDRDPAHWDVMPKFTEALKPTPVLANGDLYRWTDINALVRTSGCAGVMLARPALLNTSMFRRTVDPHTSDPVGIPLLSLERVLVEYVEESIRWDVIYQNCKYTIMEMLNNRRHQKRFCGQKADLGPSRSMQEVGKAKSVRELAAIFGFTDAAYDAIVARRANEIPEDWVTRHDDAYAADAMALRCSGAHAEGGDTNGGADTEGPVQKRVKGEGGLVVN